MGKGKGGGPVLKPKKEKEIPLYRVFLKENDSPVYLPAGKGLPQEEAQRISDALKSETYVKQVYTPEEEES